MKNYVRYINSKNKRQSAVAIKYDSQVNSAPVVKAKGKGSIAEKIIQIAKENNIPIREDPELIELLIQLDIEQEIPPELYKIIAEILAFVYSLDNKKMR